MKIVIGDKQPKLVALANMTDGDVAIVRKYPSNPTLVGEAVICYKGMAFVINPKNSGGTEWWSSINSFGVDKCAVELVDATLTIKSPQ